MPLYDYQCHHCQIIFEVRASFKEKEAGLHPECPQCHSQETHQVLTAGLLLLSSRGRRTHEVANLWAKCWARVLWKMSAPVLVQIIGAPIACMEGVKDSWREVASWAASQLTARFGPAVQVEYIDLFDPACPSLPSGAELPVVLVNSEVISSGGKISVPAIRKYLEASEIKTIQV